MMAALWILREKETEREKLSEVERERDRDRERESRRSQGSSIDEVLREGVTPAIRHPNGIDRATGLEAWLAF